jgi:radical SAM superfamily enzyme YgiQ (UPF0313 family)
MKVLFIYPDIDPYIPNYRGRLHFGLCSISACLKAVGIETFLVHITTDPAREELLKKVRRISPDIVAFSSGTNMFSYATRYSLWIKEEFKLPIICGGIHPTIDPQSAIIQEGFDMVCVGEGEEAMRELCMALKEDRDITNIRNIWVKNNGKVYQNPVRPLINNLDDLPFYDWELFNIKDLEDTQEDIGVYLASRGCPFNCSYCVNHQIKKIYSPQRVTTRFQSVERVIKEIKTLLNRYPFIKYLIFHDDTLMKNKRWFKDFCMEYRSQIGLSYMCNTRPELINDDTASLLKISGCRRVWIGIESGNEEIRRTVLKRPISTKRIKNAFEILNRHGIPTHTFNMVGIPYEDSGKILETIKLNSEIGSTGMQVTIFYPYPHTELYELCKKEGFLTNQKACDYRTTSVLSQPNISDSQIRFFARYFNLVVKLYRILSKSGNQKMVDFTDRLLTSKVFPYKLLAYTYEVIFSILKYLYVSLIRRFYKRKKYQFGAIQ